MKVFVGADHAGFRLKEELKRVIASKGFEVVDEGCVSEESVDYPDYAEKVSRAVAADKAAKGFLVCGTGIGMCIAANKIPGVRAALIYSDEVARLAREHNDANVACFGGRQMRASEVIRWALIFLNSSFTGEERHAKRIAKIEKLC